MEIIEIRSKPKGASMGNTDFAQLAILIKSTRYSFLKSKTKLRQRQSGEQLDFWCKDRSSVVEMQECSLWFMVLTKLV